MNIKYKANKNVHGFYEAQPKPSIEELRIHYTEKYWQEGHATHINEYMPEELEYFENVAKVARETAEQLKLNKSLFDIGCGEAFYSKAFNSFGWSVTCCDYSDFGIKRHNPDMLAYFISGDIYNVIEGQVLSNKKYGLISLQNVLEHVIDPLALLKSLKPLLDDKSAISVRVPNDYSDFQRALLERKFTDETWFTPPEHLSYFNKDGLIGILQECGYRLLSLQADFPIELFLSNKNSNYTKDKSLGKDAHLSRIFCENHLISKSIKDYIEYSKAAAQLGFGRLLTAYAVPL